MIYGNKQIDLLNWTREFPSHSQTILNEHLICAAFTATFGIGEYLFVFEFVFVFEGLFPGLPVYKDEKTNFGR